MLGVSTFWFWIPFLSLIFAYSILTEVVSWIVKIMQFFNTPFLLLNYLAAIICVVCRGFSGSICATNIIACKRPKKLLNLYCFENCSETRLVRELLCVLDLDVIVYPCPLYGETDGFIETSRFRPAATKIAGDFYLF